jgi:hypothetical protein
MPDYGYSFPNMNPDEYFRGINVAQLPAGMRNNNIGNIKHTDWSSKLPGAIGPSQNRDQGDPQVVFSSPEAGVAATARLALNKYSGGMNNLNTLISGERGWTPGNTSAAANIAKNMGIKADADLNLSNPDQMTKFVRALALQEHGQDSSKYSDSTIKAGVGGVFNNASTVNPAATNAAPVNANAETVAPAFSAAPTQVGYSPGMTASSTPTAPGEGAAGGEAGGIVSAISGLLASVKDDDWRKAGAKMVPLAGGLLAAGAPRSSGNAPQMGQIHRPQANQQLFAGLLRKPWDV